MGQAERRAADLRGLATGFVFDVHDRLVDVPRTDVDDFRELILRHHPEAKIGVTQPS